MTKIAIAQINPTLGDFKANADKIIQWTIEAKNQGADLVVFPECALFGYHPFDLLERSSVVEEQVRVLETLPGRLPEGVGVVLGVISFNPKNQGRRYFNSAAFIQKGKKPKLFHKQLLPAEDVFDEGRFIEPGHLADNFFRFKGRRIFICICEDIWAWGRKGERNPYRVNPLVQFKAEEVDLVINLSASPFYLGKQKTREELVAKTAKLFRAPMIYANLVGAQDEIIFDGFSFACNANGQKIVQGERFKESLCYMNLDAPSKPIRAEVIEDEADTLRRAIVTGIQDYSQKVGIPRAHLGSSGGIDSAVVACLACDALGAENISTVAMPGPFNDPKSLRLAQELAKNLNVPCLEIPISDIYEVFARDIDQHLDLNEFGLTHENLQARIRGNILMAFANSRNSLLLSTGNKSEMATGYSTLYGDMNGALAPIGDLLKGQVYKLARHYNLKKELVPEEIIVRPPSAELRPDQKDEDSLPSYDILDRAVEKLVVQAEKPRGETEKWVLAQLMRTEFKRWQAPPIIKVSRHAFGRGRRYPIAHRARV